MICQFGMELYANANSQAAKNEPTELRGNSRKAAFQQKQPLENPNGEP